MTKRGVAALLCVLALLLTGCETAEERKFRLMYEKEEQLEKESYYDSGYEEGYYDGYEAGYKEGYAEGYDDGREDR